MARETKHDRIVRTMFDQVTEHLHELKNLTANVSAKESDVERWCQSFLKNCLGYTSSAGYTIRAQETKGKMRADLIVFKGEKPIFLVEVKKLGFDLNKSDFRSGKTQLGEYLNTIGNVKWGILCNGSYWKLYDFSNTQLGGIEIASFDLEGDDDLISIDKKSVEEHCYEMIDFHESSFESDTWPELSTEATAFSPESLARAVLSADVIKYIAKSIRGEFEYKANLEVLTDKVYWLLEQGLNDAIPGWNEAKVVEYQKYVKSQKKATRKPRKTSKEKSETSLGVTEGLTKPSDESATVSVTQKVA